MCRALLPCVISSLHCELFLTQTLDLNVFTSGGYWSCTLLLMSQCVCLLQVSLRDLAEIHGAYHRLLWRKSSYAGCFVWKAGISRPFPLLLLLLSSNGDHQQVVHTRYKSALTVGTFINRSVVKDFSLSLGSISYTKT